MRLREDDDWSFKLLLRYKLRYYGVELTLLTAMTVEMSHNERIFNKTSSRRTVNAEGAAGKEGVRRGASSALLDG
jgi:hypothetical protein